MLASFVRALFLVRTYLSNDKFLEALWARTSTFLLVVPFQHIDFESPTLILVFFIRCLAVIFEILTFNLELVEVDPFV